MGGGPKGGRRGACWLLRHFGLADFAKVTEKKGEAESDDSVIFFALFDRRF